jgi:Tfp pilus assembly protein PilF
LAACAAAALAAAAASQPTPPRAVTAREDAYRANNIGVTRLEQFDFEAAAASFRRALETDPRLAIARLNLGIALFYRGDPEAARREIAAARPDLPDTPHPDYLLGLIARGAGRTEEAIEAFTRAERLDPGDAGTAINLGQLYRQERKYQEAIDAFRRAMEAAPYNATAAYGLANTLILGGRGDEGRAAMAHFQRLSESSYAITYSQTYLAQGRYAEAITSTGAEAPLVDTRIPDVTFADATATVPPGRAPGAGDRVAGSVATFDLDGDGNLDVVESGAAGVRLLRNAGGRFTDVTADMLGGVAAGPADAVLAGDYDNDGHADLVVLRPGGIRLLRRDPAAGFTDVTAGAELGSLTDNPRSAAWLDADHDGDLDLFVAGGAGGAGGAAGADGSPATRLFRNNGTGRFTDITTESGLAVATSVLAVVPTDYDNRRDIDLLLVRAAAPPLLFRNLRDGTFRDVAADVGLTLDGGAAMAAIGDVNKDGYPDLFFPRRNGTGVMASSNGLGRFTTSTAPAETADARAAQFIDYDNDGLLDLFLLTARGPRLLRNLGREWTDVTSRAIRPAMAASLADATSLATGDLDGDGRVDVVVRGPSGLAVWRNDGASRMRSLRVRLTSRVSNRSAVGAKIEMRAGSLRQQHETYAATPAPAPADVLFGLGDRAGADVVRVLWPSGILQAETGESPTAPSAGEKLTGVLKGMLTGVLNIEELDRKPSSCPYLYTWNGERFEFITDFLGGGEMGYWLAPGARNTPDPDEYVRIDSDRLRPKNGRYELRITNELEESLFLDRVQLVAVAHPRDVSVHPNEGLVPELRAFTLYSSRDPQPPLAASDEQGRDVLDRILRLDRRYPDGFLLERVRGYAGEHTLALTLPPPGPGGRRLLLLTGWTDYAFSGDNVAAHQAGLPLLPPSLEVKGPDGDWHTAIEDIGMPVGRPQTVVVDLSGKIPTTARDVRIRTTMRIYWDRVLVDTSNGRAPLTMNRLDPVTANLRWRGFSAASSPDGREPYGYDYGRVSPLSPWKLLPGRYTREGDVATLLLRTDDMFVVSRPGDEIALAFDAAALPPLPEGWTRTFLLYADGFSKEMNLHSSSPDELLPLPFHGMTQYPYAAPEAYPSTPAHREYVERYNTRVVPRTIPSLDLMLDHEVRTAPHALRR